MESRDLALDAAFTSMSLCDRCSEPGVEGTLELTSLPSTAEQHVGHPRQSFNEDIRSALRCYPIEKDKLIESIYWVHFGILINP